MTTGIAVVGGGIVGLAVARALAASRPGVVVTVLEKEDVLAQHQTGHNSGVVHAGLYYAPGSLKATLCSRGRAMLREYCQHKGVVFQPVGKLVVATEEAEQAPLAAIYDRAMRNGVPGIRLIGREAMLDIEPRVAGVEAVHSPETAITNFAAVARCLAADVETAGGRVELGVRVEAVAPTAGGATVIVNGEPRQFASVVVCAGLGTGRLGGVRSDQFRIVAFRGSYYQLADRVRDHVRGLVYPVPDPRYPFLGVHLTRRWDGEILVGPNAILALASEGYSWRDVDMADLRLTAGFPGFWRMCAGNWEAGLREVLHSSRRGFLRTACRYLPELRGRDLLPGPAGVRAQAIDRAGTLVDDFVVETSGQVTVVLNAPSPAATSSLAIADHVVGQLRQA
jgi:L-2-hydroxyglutarate oxidase